MRVHVGGELQSGAPFELSYRLVNCTGIDADRLVGPVALELWKGPKKINRLVVGGDIQPPDGIDTPLVDLRGAGPWRYRLPSVAAGDYVLCAPDGLGIAPNRNEPAQEFQSFCVPVTVTRQ